MADTDLQVELVAADRVVWSGEATMIITRTMEGELGILANHIPVMAVLVDGTVEIRTSDGERKVAAINGGFLSVANNRVSILSADAQLSDDIDADQARRDVDNADGSADEDSDDANTVRFAQARIRAVELAS
jgi:F-type H+-transporting ATPase subunit epsilon